MAHGQLRPPAAPSLPSPPRRAPLQDLEICGFSPPQPASPLVAAAPSPAAVTGWPPGATPASIPTWQPAVMKSDAPPQPSMWPAAALPAPPAGGGSASEAWGWQYQQLPGPLMHPSMAALRAGTGGSGGSSPSGSPRSGSPGVLHPPAWAPHEPHHPTIIKVSARLEVACWSPACMLLQLSPHFQRHPGPPLPPPCLPLPAAARRQPPGAW